MILKFTPKPLRSGLGVLFYTTFAKKQANKYGRRKNYFFNGGGY